IVSSQKAIQLTKKLDFASYFECSAKTQHGLKQVFETAIEIAIEKRRKFQYYTPPPLPTADPAPLIQIEKSTFGEDWKEFLNHKFCADVQFIVEGKSLKAHKAILCCASSLFRKLFNLILTEDEETTIHLENLSDYGVDYIQEDKKSRKTVITMNKNMKITVFQ